MMHSKGAENSLLQKNYLRLNDCTAPDIVSVESISIVPKELTSPIKTNQDLIMRQIMKTNVTDGSQRLGDVFDKSKEVIKRLTRLGMFSSVQVALDSPRNPDAPYNALSLNVILAEKKTQKLSIGGAMEGFDKMMIMASAKKENALGSGESVNIQANFFLSRSSIEWSLFKTPL